MFTHTLMNPEQSSPAVHKRLRVNKLESLDVTENSGDTRQCCGKRLEEKKQFFQGR